MYVMRTAQIEARILSKRIALRVFSPHHSMMLCPILLVFEQGPDPRRCSFTIAAPLHVVK